MKEYNSFSAKVAKHHGKKSMVKVLKDLNNRTKLSVIGVVRTDILMGGIWISPNPNTGIPKALPSLSKLVGSDDWGKRIATSITAQVETLRLPPSSDISTITDTYTGDRGELSIWSQMCLDYSRDNWRQIFKPMDRKDRYHTSMSSGPNGGSSLISSVYDTGYFVRNPHMLELYHRWCDVFSRSDLKEMIVDCYNSLTELRQKYKHLNKVASRKEPLRPAKLIFLADKAGKTRVVYCLSWWVQELLHPLHRGLYKLLYSLPEDGTKSHSEAASVVKQWTAEGRKLWSVDLTAATDRFPKELQVAVISGLLGKQQAEAWSEIMAIKPWSQVHNEYVEYGTGQPMGAKTSWATFALTHHTILRLLCSYRQCYDNPYRIIGDDIVIANDKVANDYMGLLNTLGVPYSEGKTIFPKEGGKSAAEFAKRIFCNGVEYSPLTPSLVDRVWKYRDYSVFLSVLRELESKWGSGCHVTREHLHFLPPACALFNLIPIRWKETLAVTIGGQVHLGSLKGDNPASTEVVSLLYPNPWAGVEKMTYYFALGEAMTNRVQGYVDLLTKINVFYGDLGELPEKASVGRVLFHIQSNPFHKVVSRVGEVTKEVYRSISNGDTNLQMVMDLGIDLQYMVSLALTGKSWESHKRLLERRDKKTVTYWKTVLKNTVPQDSGPVDNWEDW